MDSNVENGTAIRTIDSISGRGAQMFTSPVADLGRGTQLLSSFGRGTQLLNSFGRGVRVFNSPVASPGDVRSPAFSSTSRVDVPDNVASSVFTSTHLPSHTPLTHRPTLSLSAIPDRSDPALSDLITHIAQQVGQSISAQLKGVSQANEGAQARVENSGAGQSFVDSTLNLTHPSPLYTSCVQRGWVRQAFGT